MINIGSCKNGANFHFSCKQTAISQLYWAEDQTQAIYRHVVKITNTFNSMNMFSAGTEMHND